jgi:flagellar hook-basal body complex protein FliE
MSSMQIDGVLAQIRSLQQQSKIGALNLRPSQDLAGPGAAKGTAPTDFASVLKAGLDKVNDVQSSATRLATAFEKGTPGVELSQVMLESQKASVSFRAAVEVRNRLVTAYQEIMNMPI